MVAVQPVAMSAGKAAATALHRPATVLRQPPGRAPRPPAQRYRPAILRQATVRRAQGQWLRPAGIFALKLFAGAVAGVAVAIAIVLWRDGWHPAPSPQPERDQPASSSDRAETTIYPRAVPPQRSARGWEAHTTESWFDRAPPSNYPRRVKTETFARPAEVTASVPSTAAAPRTDAPPAFPSLRLPQVKSWRYQLQNIDPAEIANSPHDLVVIDYSGADGPFSNAQVERMKQKPDGSRRIVLAYMSIGEAEDYRWYWSQRSASWLGAENPKWRGNYGVRFWDSAWQDIILTYTDLILAAGFDGVYLDKVDEFEDMGHRDDMVEFVSRIAARAKSQRSDFLVISQNGDELLSDTKFRHAIDGFAREDLFYGEESDGKRNRAASIHESVKRLKMLAAEGKPVFVVEYPRTDKQAQTARREISEQGFIGLMARRALNAL
jgi:cysteinyl-tRNA synthetase, unknown class